MDESVTRTVDALINAGLLDADDRGRAVEVASAADASPARSRGLLSEISGYIGGILVLAAAGVFIATQWSAMSSVVRVAVLVLCAAVLAAGGFAVRRVAGGQAHVQRHLASTLLVAGAWVFGAAASVADESFLEAANPWPQIVGFAIAALLSIVAYATAPSPVAQIGIALPATMALSMVSFELVRGHNDSIAFGVAMLLLAVAWAVAAERRLLQERTIGRVIYGAIAVIGAQVMRFGSSWPWLAYLALALLGVIGFVLYARWNSWPHLMLGVVASTLAATEATIDWSNGALGAAGALLIAGACLLVFSALGMRMRRRDAMGLPDSRLVG